MSENKPPPIRRSSGQTPAVQIFRKKMESMETSTLPEVQRATREIKKVAQRFAPDKPKVPRPDPSRESKPRIDARREPREEDDTLVDVTDFEESKKS